MLQDLLAYWQGLLLAHWYTWAVFAIYLVVAWFAALVVRALMHTIVTRVVTRWRSEPDHRTVAIAVTPVRWVVLALGLQAALQVLGERIPGLRSYSEFAWMIKAVTALVIVAVAQMTLALLRGGLNWYLHSLPADSRGTWDRDLLPVVRRVATILVYFIAVSMILRHFNQDITALVTTAGVASLAVALAAQETLSNMLGGFVILVDRPFKLGNSIELADGKGGEVVAIGLRSTRIKQFDGNALVVPNKDMANSRIVNMDLLNDRAAIRQTINIESAADVEKAKALILQVIQAHPDVLPEPAPGVWFTKFQTGALELQLACWVVSYRDRMRVTDQLNVHILKAFREAGITFP